MEDRPTMTDDEMIKDYPRLKYEYSQLYQDYKKFKRKLREQQTTTDTKQLIIGDVMQIMKP
jgi:hypothetical protein